MLPLMVVKCEPRLFEGLAGFLGSFLRLAVPRTIRFSNRRQVSAGDRVVSGG
jgi:hypothetical protein